MKRFFFLSTLFIVLVSVPIYAASKIFLPEWLKDEVISKLPLGTELSVGQVSSNYDLSILYEDVIYNSPGYKLEFNNFLIEPRINMASPLVAKADSARLITSANAIVFKKLEVKLVLSDIYFEDISLDGHISKIEGLNNSILNDATFLFEGLRKANKVLNLSAESLISDLQTPLGIVKLKLENFHTVASLNKKLDVSSAADFLDFAFIPKASDLTPKIISAHDLNFDFELVKTKNWDLPFKLSAKNFSSPSGHLVQSGEVMARGNWGNESTNCEIMAILSNQGSCGKIINIFDLSMDLQDPSGTIKFDGNGYCVAPKSGCPQRIDARIMSKSTANIFSQIMRSGLINPLVGGILIGGLLGSPVVENPNYDHSVDLSMRGSMVLLNGKPLI